jgi:uncharacterized membrane protein YdjX (TVP38/TMEM64 family)
MRLVPLVTFTLFNCALCRTGVSLSAYTLTSAVCMLLGTIVYIWLGYAGRSAIVGDTAACAMGSSVWEYLR